MKNPWTARSLGRLFGISRDKETMSERGLEILRNRCQFIYIKIRRKEKEEKEAILKSNCGRVKDIHKFFDVLSIMG